MALFGKLVSLALSPQGRNLLTQAQKAARDPQNRERLEKARSRIKDRATTVATGTAGRTREDGAGGDPSAGEPRH